MISERTIVKVTLLNGRGSFLSFLWPGDRTEALARRKKAYWSGTTANVSSAPKLADRVVIVGAGYEGFRPFISDLSTRELMFEAAAKAYDDASVDPRRDVGSFICCTEDLWEGWSITDEMVPDQIGGAKKPLCTIPADAITGLGNAMMHILSGVAELVVLEAHSKVSDVLDKESVEQLAQEPSMMRPLGVRNDVLAALEMDGFLRGSGYQMSDVDQVVRASKGRALKNPRASFGMRGTDVESSGMISTPLRDVDRAPYAEAGIVLVLASERWAKKNRRDPVNVDSVFWSSSLPWFDGGGFQIAGYARQSYLKALERAGIARNVGLKAFDIVEVDDTYSYKALQHLHSLSGSRSETRKVISGEARAVFNPSGGSLGVGNLLEASALHRLLECYLQLKGEAGGVQVKGARRALVQSWRGVPTATGGVAILSR